MALSQQICCRGIRGVTQAVSAFADYRATVYEPDDDEANIQLSLSDLRLGVPRFLVDLRISARLNHF